MIGRLSGIIIYKQPPQLLLDVNGVGYEIDAPMSTFYRLPEEGQQVHILIYTYVREDALQLFGFATALERRFFKALIKISGVGAKMALTILSGITAETFARYVQQGDSKALTKLPGVGAKTAQRLIIEMKDKLEKEIFNGLVQLPVGSLSESDIQKMEQFQDSPMEEAINALIALGYKLPEASKMVSVIVNEGETTEQLIRLALQRKVK